MSSQDSHWSSTTARRLASTIIALLVLAGASACTPAPTTNPWISVTTYVRTVQGGLDGGVLGYLDNYNGCLVVRQPSDLPDRNPNSFVIVAFPQDEVAFPSTDSVSLFGATYHLGDQISFGGGISDAKDWSFPSSCAGARDQVSGVDSFFLAWH